jgi:hypothetical protein
MLELVALLVFALPIWASQGPVPGTPPGAAVPVFAWIGATVIRLPTFVGPIWSQSFAAAQALFASTALLVSVPTAIHFCLQHAEHTSSISAAGLLLVTLTAAPVALLPALPLWTTMVPAVPSAIGFVAVIGYHANQGLADLDAGTVASTGVSLALVLLLLLVLRSDNGGSNAGDWPTAREEDERARARVIPAGELSRGNSLSRWTSDAFRHASTLARMSVRPHRRSSEQKGVDLRSDVDRARMTLQALQPSLARNLPAAAQSELTAAITLLQKNRGAGEETNFDFDDGLADVDRETAAFLKGTLSLEYMREGSWKQRRSGLEALDDWEDSAEWKDGLHERTESIFRQLQSSTERQAASDALDDWSADVIHLHERTNGHALLMLGTEIFNRLDLVSTCSIEQKSLSNFLVAMEEGYGTNPYHNSIHAADVLLGTYLFLNKFNCAGRLSKRDLLAGLVGAIVHDFNHPGTTNAHEMKVISRLAVTYSDRSPLESHHLASSFRVLNTAGCDIIGSLGSEGYRDLRKLIIEIVLHTDLSKHFEFISKLQALVADTRVVQKQEAELRTANMNARRSSLKSESPLGRTSGREKTAIAPADEENNGTVGTHKVGQDDQKWRRKSSDATMIRTPTDDDSSFNDNPREGRRPSNVIAAPKVRRGSHIMAAARRGSMFSNKAAPEALIDEPVTSPFLDESKVDVQMLLITAVKFADLGHCFKVRHSNTHADPIDLPCPILAKPRLLLCVRLSPQPWNEHQLWTHRITEEFWALGDQEKMKGVPKGPLCNRQADNNIPKSQGGFFQFICIPFYKEVAALLLEPDSRFMLNINANAAKWKALLDGEQALDENA